MEYLNFKFDKTLTKDVSIHIGKSIVTDINTYLAKINPDKVFIVCDSMIINNYGKQIKKNIQQCYKCQLIELKVSENNKNFKNLEFIIDNFFKYKGTQKSCFCSLGGGIVCNMTGLAASLVYRGISLVHIPTTLLSQVDVAPDVKQSVNSFQIKNSIGQWKAPDLVLIDPLFLNTLSDREMRTGLAEALKHGFSQDLSLVKYITTAIKKKVLRNEDVLETIIYKTISLKIQHWNNTPNMWNELEKTEKLTHIGHTVGKILEMVQIDYLSHGEAISHGMLIEFYISYLLGYVDMDFIKYAKEILTTTGLLYPLNKNYTSKKIINLMYQNYPLFAILKSPGSSNIESTSLTKKIVKKAVDWYLKEEKIRK